MSATDKIRDIAQDTAGRVKEAAGERTDDEELIAEGQGDRAAVERQRHPERVEPRSS